MNAKAIRKSEAQKQSELERLRFFLRVKRLQHLELKLKDLLLLPSGLDKASTISNISTQFSFFKGPTDIKYPKLN